MTASELIQSFRQTSKKGSLDSLKALFSFRSITNENGLIEDSNLNFRIRVVEGLLYDFSLADIYLIRDLFNEEIRCELATRRHDNLYQLCFYLYSLGQLEDTFILYDAKFNAPNMDVASMLDGYAITVGHEIDEVISYVEGEFIKNPLLEDRYPTIINELKDMQEYPSYDSVETYTNFIKGYFLGHKE